MLKLFGIILLAFLFQNVEIPDYGELWQSNAQYWLMEDLAESLYDYRENVLLPLLDDKSLTADEREILEAELERINNYIDYTVEHPDDDKNACGQIALATLLKVPPGMFVVDAAAELDDPTRVTTARELEALMLVSGSELETKILSTNGEDPVEMLVDEIVAGRLPMILIPLEAAGGEAEDLKTSHWILIHDINAEYIRFYNSLTNTFDKLPTSGFELLVLNGSDGHENIFSVQNPFVIRTRL